MTATPWSMPVAVADIPETGRQVDLVADAQVRAALAKIAGVPGVPKLTAEFGITRHGRDGVRVVGHVSAIVEQKCVLTLEPMEGQVEEEVDLLFVPQAEASTSDGKPTERATSDEPPEVLHNGIVDLGVVATEFLLLGIDPYPRKPGSVFDAPKAKESEADHPFAALAALKKGKDRTDK